jgi:radical SAM-linked protein
MEQIIKYPLKCKLVKSGEMIYFSQLDLVTILERALRRSGLPVYFSQGFNPRIKISFHGGLKLGVEGEVETTFYFLRPINIDELKTSLNPQLPSGLTLVQ